jgi:signal peptidase I
VAKREKSAAGSFVELVVIVIVALGLALGIQAFLVKPYRIPSESMVPTLKVGQRVLVNRLGNHFGNPSVGDVVVFNPPAMATDNSATGFGLEGKCAVRPRDGQPCPQEGTKKSGTTFIKRIVAGPGDRLEIRGGHVILNGKRQQESFTAPCGGSEGCNLTTPLVVPRGHYFMMGDNRGSSDDSRFWGPVPRDWVIGGAFATYWPPKRIGLL